MTLDAAVGADAGVLQELRCRGAVGAENEFETALGVPAGDGMDLGSGHGRGVEEEGFAGWVSIDGNVGGGVLIVGAESGHGPLRAGHRRPAVRRRRRGER